MSDKLDTKDLAERVVGLVNRLEKENEDLKAVLSNTISGWDYEEVSHHCGVDAETASRVIELLNK